MKKISLIAISFFICSFFIFQNKINAQSVFYQAVKTCEDYSLSGEIESHSEVFNLLITLKKSKNGQQCIYKEKIFQNDEFQMLTCNFSNNQLQFLSTSMEKFTKAYKSQVDANRIFEAKMTTNNEIFQKYLVNKNICQITHSKKK